MLKKLLKTLANKAAQVFGYELVAISRNGFIINYRGIRKLLYFKRMLDHVKNVKGDIVECGVASGGSFVYLAILAKEENQGRKLWGFDSFEGFPEISAEDKISGIDPKKGDMRASVTEVSKLLARSRIGEDFIESNISFVKGFFNESLKKYKGGPIALLHVDVDIYDSYVTVLHELFPKVAVGGIVLFDEYMNSVENVNWPGAKKAIDEYFANTPFSVCRDEFWGKFYLIKTEAWPPKK